MCIRCGSTSSTRLQGEVARGCVWFELKYLEPMAGQQLWRAAQAPSLCFIIPKTLPHNTAR